VLCAVPTPFSSTRRPPGSSYPSTPKPLPAPGPPERSVAGMSSRPDHRRDPSRPPRLPVARQAGPTAAAWSTALPQADEKDKEDTEDTGTLGLTRTIIEVCGEPAGADGMQLPATKAMPAEAGPPQLQAARQERVNPLDCSPPEVPRTSLPLVLIVE
jgi:hypothetical protein